MDVADNMTWHAQSEVGTAESHAPRQNVVILVPGMHRSGTSAISGLLNCMGAAIPGDLLPPQADNAKGYFENQRVVAFNDALLQDLGSRWDDPLPLDDDCFRSPVARAAVGALAALLRDEFGGHPLVLVKDPRLCRLLPVWIEALQQVGREIVAVLPWRYPLEVAASLQRRNALPVAHALALWLQHTLAAERASRTLRRCFVSYDDVLQDWQAVVRKLAGALGLAWPRDINHATPEISEFLSRELRHHWSPPTALPAADALHRLCTQAWNAVTRLSGDSSDATTLAMLDAVGREFQDALGVFGVTHRRAGQKFRSGASATSRVPGTVCEPQ